ncbi:MAG TPA: L,D-transpeptidase family protein [Rhodanobacteraceae bacterium]|nr:L,D-transpeptidase family protein [Rhodanobacteraceae bacterium]
MVLVLLPGWDSTQGTLRRFERDGSGWREVGAAAPIVVGRNGAAWGLGLNAPIHDSGPIKREGDGRSPAGVFAIGEAFGYAAGDATALPYTAMTASDWCVDVSGSPYYNRIVDAASVGADAVAGASEHMRLDLFNHGDQRYRLGFVIEHNRQQHPGGGSCIFAHLWSGPTSTTSGCTAMADPTMQRLLAWLDPAQQPVFVLLPDTQYARLRTAWQLPRVELNP